MYRFGLNKDLQECSHAVYKLTSFTHPPSLELFLEAAGIVEKKERNNPKKAQPGKKAVERAEEKAAKAADAAEAAESAEA